MHKLLLLFGIAILCVPAFTQTDAAPLPLKVLSAQRGEAFKFGSGPGAQTVKPKKAADVMLVLRIAGKGIDKVKLDKITLKDGDATYSAGGWTFTHDAAGKLTRGAVLIAVPRAKRKFTLFVEGYVPIPVVAEAAIRAELSFP